jgi:hypothetical protein
MADGVCVGVDDGTLVTEIGAGMIAATVGADGVEAGPTVGVDDESGVGVETGAKSAGPGAVGIR